MKADLDGMGLALEVVVVLASGHFAGTDAGDSSSVVDVRSRTEVGIAHRVSLVADGDGPCVTVPVGVVGTVVDCAGGHGRHVDGEFHGDPPSKCVRSPVSRRGARRMKDCERAYMLERLGVSRLPVARQSGGLVCW